jgi:hypothetical protein
VTRGSVGWPCRGEISWAVSAGNGWIWPPWAALTLLLLLQPPLAQYGPICIGKTRVTVHRQVKPGTHLALVDFLAAFCELLHLVLGAVAVPRGEVELFAPLTHISGDQP